MTRLRLAGLVAAAIVFVPFAAAASDQDDALRLAQRIASRGGYVDASVTLHALPKDFPASIPLPRATLLGSVVQSISQSAAARARGRIPGATMTTRTTTTNTVGATATAVVVQPVTLYYEAPAGRDATVAAYEAALAQAGWKAAPDIMSRMPIPQGGFRLPFPQITVWCSPAEPRAALNIVDAEDAAGFDLSVSASDRGTAFQCGDASSPFEVFQWQRSPLPTFTTPNGVRMTASGPAGDGTTTAARIESSLGIRAVFDAFAKQLTDAGWAASAGTGTETVRTQTFKKTVDGTPYITLLTLYALDATHYAALADVRDAR
jgi:hypothetical protein